MCLRSLMIFKVKSGRNFFMPSINLPVLPMAAGRWLAPEVVVSSCSLLGPRPGGKPGILCIFVYFFSKMQRVRTLGYPCKTSQVVQVWQLLESFYLSPRASNNFWLTSRSSEKSLAAVGFEPGAFRHELILQTTWPLPLSVCFALMTF